MSDLDGLGDTVGGIVIVRHGENALNVINRVKDRLKELEPSLPPGVEIVTNITHDCSTLIERTIEILGHELTVEMILSPPSSCSSSGTSLTVVPIARPDGTRTEPGRPGARRRRFGDSRSGSVASGAAPHSVTGIVTVRRKEQSGPRTVDRIRPR